MDSSFCHRAATLIQGSEGEVRNVAAQIGNDNIHRGVQATQRGKQAVGQGCEDCEKPAFAVLSRRAAVLAALATKDPMARVQR